MPSPALLAAVAGGSKLGAGLFKLYGPERRQRRMAYSLDKARAHAALARVLREQEFRQTEDPREAAMLKQSLAARGLGDSTISQQDTSRLKAIQANRQMALAEHRDIAERSLSMLRRRRKFERRMSFFNLLMESAAAAGGAAAGIGGGEVPPPAGG